MNKKNHNKMLVGGVIATLSFLPGCMDMFKANNTNPQQTETSAAQPKSSLTGEVLVTMKGAPAITTESLQVEKEKFLKANPQIKQALAFMDPKSFDRNMLEGLIHQIIVDEHIVSNKIHETAEYQAELKDLYQSMERMLNSKYFSEQKAVSIPDSEVRSFYEANKDKLRGIRISQGGIAATGIEFADGAAARAFAARVKTSPGGFKKIAQDDGLTGKIKDFKLVNDESTGLDEQLRDKIAAIKTVPSVEIFEVNGMFWVVSATSKEDSKYIPYDQVKDNLKQQLEQNRRVEEFEKEINVLRSEYDVKVNEDYFKSAEMPQDEMPAQEVAAHTVNAHVSNDAADKRLA